LTSAQSHTACREQCESRKSLAILLFAKFRIVCRLPGLNLDVKTDAVKIVSSCVSNGCDSLNEQMAVELHNFTVSDKDSLLKLIVAVKPDNKELASLQRVSLDCAFVVQGHSACYQAVESVTKGERDVLVRASTTRTNNLLSTLLSGMEFHYLIKADKEAISLTDSAPKPSFDFKYGQCCPPLTCLTLGLL